MLGGLVVSKEPGDFISADALRRRVPRPPGQHRDLARLPHIAGPAIRGGRSLVDGVLMQHVGCGA
jgi:hypothetical protein